MTDNLEDKLWWIMGNVVPLLVNFWVVYMTPIGIYLMWTSYFGAVPALLSEIDLWWLAAPCYVPGIIFFFLFIKKKKQGAVAATLALIVSALFFIGITTRYALALGFSMASPSTVMIMTIASVLLTIFLYFEVLEPDRIPAETQSSCGCGRR